MKERRKAAALHANQVRRSRGLFVRNTAGSWRSGRAPSPPILTKYEDPHLSRLFPALPLALVLLRSVTFPPSVSGLALLWLPTTVLFSPFAFLNARLESQWRRRACNATTRTSWSLRGVIVTGVEYTLDNQVHNKALCLRTASGASWIRQERRGRAVSNSRVIFLLGPWKTCSDHPPSRFHSHVWERACSPQRERRPDPRFRGQAKEQESVPMSTQELHRAPILFNPPQRAPLRASKDYSPHHRGALPFTSIKTIYPAAVQICTLISCD